MRKYQVIVFYETFVCVALAGDEMCHGEYETNIGYEIEAENVNEAKRKAMKQFYEDENKGKIRFFKITRIEVNERGV